MVSVSVEREKKITIQQMLHKYAKHVIGLSMLSFGLVILLFIGMVIQHKRDNAYFLELNGFYNQLDMLNEEMYNGLITGNTNWADDLNVNLKEMHQMLNNLKTLDVEKRFQRDIRDLIGLNNTYGEKITELYGLYERGNTIASEEVRLVYDETQEAYDFIGKDFKRVYSQILNIVAERENRRYAVNMVLGCLFAAEFFIALRYLIKKANKMSDKIVRPIQLLVQEVKTVETGNLENELSTVHVETCSEEIQILSHALTSMKHRLHQQMQEIIANVDLKMRIQEKELENLRINNQLRQSQLKALQMQINPHFMFNTLNMITKTAYMEGADDTVSLLEYTADYLRYALDNSDRAVTLEKEMEALGNYVYIQEQRFGDQIQFLFRLDESFHHMKIPSIILQPIVENSIIHGKGKRPEITIEIETRYLEKEKKGLICISDNGGGMSPENLERVREELWEKDDEVKIGLKNINQRLQIFFKGQAKLEIESRIGEGTAVSIFIPVADRG